MLVQERRIASEREAHIIIKREFLKEQMMTQMPRLRVGRHRRASEQGIVDGRKAAETSGREGCICEWASQAEVAHLNQTRPALR